MVCKPCECDGATAHRAEMKQQEQSRAEEDRERVRFRNVQRLFAEIPGHFHSRTFGSYVVTEQNRAAYELAKGYPFGEGKKGVLLTGRPGVGKTHLAAAVAIEQVKLQRSVIFGTVPAILSRIKATFDCDGGPTEAEVTNAIMSCSLLVLDDLGKEKPSEWVEEKLYEIINTRYVRGLPVIITTNVGLNAVQARYPWNGEAIVSRLFEMCRGAQVAGEDYRRRR